MRYLETARGVSNAEMVARIREKHIDNVSRTHTYIHTYKYSNFLVNITKALEFTEEYLLSY